MHKQPRSLFVLLLIFSVSSINIALAQSHGGGAPLKPPMAEKKTKTTNIHGETLVDEYFWLREKTNPDVMAYLKAEDDYAESMMKPTKHQSTRITVASTTKVSRSIHHGPISRSARCF